MQPAPQQAAAHGGDTSVHHRQQCIAVAAGHIDVDFQVAAGRRIQDHALGAALLLHAANVGQVAALGIFHILQQAAGSADGQFEIVAAKALQVVGLELGVQGARALSTSNSQAGWLRAPWRE